GVLALAESGQFIRRNIKHLIHFSYAQKLADIGRGIDQGEVATATADRDVGANQFSQAGAIQEIDALQIQKDSPLAAVQESANGLAQKGTSFIERDLSGKSCDRGPGDLPDSDAALGCRGLTNAQAQLVQHFA